MRSFNISLSVSLICSAAKVSICIWDRVGYKTASAVHKRIAKIAGAYEDFVLSEYQQYLDRHDSK